MAKSILLTMPDFVDDCLTEDLRHRNKYKSRNSSRYISKTAMINNILEQYYKKDTIEEIEGEKEEEDGER